MVTDCNVPVHKKMIACFNVKTNDHADVIEITHHNNPRKILYYKNFKGGDIHLSPADNIRFNLVFELG